jgi:hypothetical protein
MITIDVWLYGPLARYGGPDARPSYANLKVSMPADSSLGALLDHLNLPTEERGITFVNGTLSAMPGLQPDLDYPLQNGDRLALFHLKSMWPFQYRHGAALAPGLARSLREGDGHALHHQSPHSLHDEFDDNNMNEGS